MVKPGDSWLLDSGFVTSVEALLGTRIGDVWIQESPLPGALGVRACAIGNRICFAPGEFDPGTPAGMALLGHELAHIAQQLHLAAPARFTLLCDDRLEREADRCGEMLARTYQPGVLQLIAANADLLRAPAFVQCTGFGMPRRRFGFDVLGMLYDLTVGAVYREPCFPVLRRQESMESRSKEMIANAKEELVITTAVQRRSRTGSIGSVVTPPEPLTRTSTDPAVRQIELTSQTSILGSTSATQVKIEALSTQPASKPVTLPSVPESSPLPDPSVLVERLKKVRLDLENQIQILLFALGQVAQDVDDPMVDAILKKANAVLSTLTIAPDEKMFEPVRLLLDDAKRRLQTDEVIQQMLHKFLIKAKIGPKKEFLGSVHALELKLAQVNGEGELSWPVADALWRGFKTEFAREPRKLNDAEKTFKEISVIIGLPGKGENMRYMGSLTEDDFDDQERNKLNDIRLAGKSGVWGGRIGKAYTGHDPDNVDHYTIPSSNKTLFFKWVVDGIDVLEVHGVGQHIGKDNKEYGVTKWSNGRSFNIDLNKKKPNL